jgi:hypothetical protein
VALVRTDVSEELSTSFIRVTRIGEMGTTLAVTSNRLTLRRNAINDIRLISNPIQAPSHELDEIEIKILPINVVDERIFVALLGIREESYYSMLE